MQTFIPYGRCFSANAKVLDRQRLGKQRVEGFQILRTLAGFTNGWGNHPAVKMWTGYEEALGQYTLAICDEWTARGYADTCADKIRSIVPGIELTTAVDLPEWLDLPAITLSHKSNLVRKYPEHYANLWPNVPDDLPYVWPV